MRFSIALPASVDPLSFAPLSRAVIARIESDSERSSMERLRDALNGIARADERMAMDGRAGKNSRDGCLPGIQKAAAPPA